MFIFQHPRSLMKEKYPKRVRVNRSIYLLKSIVLRKLSYRIQKIGRSTCFSVGRILSMKKCSRITGQRTRLSNNTDASLERFPPVGSRSCPPAVNHDSSPVTGQRTCQFSTEGNHIFHNTISF